MASVSGAIFCIMKILSVDQIRAADAYTITHEPIGSVDLMERAAQQCFYKILELFPEKQIFHVFCGTGNNGGDGLAIARLLHLEGKNVSVTVVRFSPNESPDFSINFHRLLELKIPVVEIVPGGPFNPFSVPIQDSLVIDALLGSGVTRRAEGLLASVISIINHSKIPVVAIDLPSGMFGEKNTDENRKVAIKAKVTLCFQLPKLLFFLSENYNNVGDWYILNIGLNSKFIEAQPTDFEMIDQAMIHSIIHTRNPFDHKGSYGHALIIAGSFGKMGAAVLASEACLRSGAGLLSVFSPKCGYEILQERIPEAMVITATSEKAISGEVPSLNYDSIGVGPGLATDEPTQNFIVDLVTLASKSLVIDADAINILSLRPELMTRLPVGSILTPHPKEFERLFGPTIDSETKIRLQQTKSLELGLVIVLKGRYTSISTPEGKTYFNTTGNPGMGTGGSGDVLTGILTGLMAQGYSSSEAAILGVHVHGLAGDLAAAASSEEAMIASDITAHLGNAFTLLHE